MSHSSQKEWTKTMCMSRLKDIETPLRDLIKLSENGGRMPRKLRNNLEKVTDKVTRLFEEFNAWQPQIEKTRKRKKP